MSIEGYKYVLVRKAGLTNGKTVAYNDATGRFEPVELGSGDGGPGAPDELLPLTLSRMAPWAGWTQFNSPSDDSGFFGLPINTMSFGRFRFGLAFAAYPLMTVQLESLGPVPIIAGTGQTVNFSLTALGVNFGTGEFPENTFTRVKIQLASMSEEGGEEVVDLGAKPLIVNPFTSYPTEEAIDGVFEAATRRDSLVIPDQSAIFGIEISVEDSEGEALAAELGNTIMLNRVSMWQGSPEANTVVNVNLGSTFMGMQVQTGMMTRYTSPLFGDGVLGIGPYGLAAVKPNLEDPENSAAVNLSVVEVGSGPNGLAWSMDRARVQDAPVNPKDVVRLEDLGEEGPTSAYSHDALVVTEDATIDPQTVPWLLVDLTVANITVELNNPSSPSTLSIHVRNLGDVMRYFTLHGANGFNSALEVNPGDQYLVTAIGYSPETPDDPDIAELEVHSRQLVHGPVEVPCTAPQGGPGVVVDGVIPLAYRFVELDPVPSGEHPILEFEDPGPGRYAIRHFGYTAGPAGEGYGIDGANHYVGGDSSNPPAMTPNLYYRWEVYIWGGGAGGGFKSDFRQIPI